MQSNDIGQIQITIAGRMYRAELKGGPLSVTDTILRQIRQTDFTFSQLTQLRQAISEKAVDKLRARISSERDSMKARIRDQFTGNGGRPFIREASIENDVQDGPYVSRETPTENSACERETVISASHSHRFQETDAGYWNLPAPVRAAITRDEWIAAHEAEAVCETSL